MHLLHHFLTQLKTTVFIKRKLFILLFIILIALGVIVTSIGGYWFYSYANPPTLSSDPNYQGFAIARNSTINPIAMNIELEVNPSELSFQYFYNAQLNGTYNFIFVFPFHVTGIVDESENMSINPTNTCTVFSLSLNLTKNNEYWESEQISGDFMIAQTFLSGSRGLYTMVLPFSGGVGGETYNTLQQKLEVGIYSPDAPITLGVILPAAYSVTESFPSMAGVNPYIMPFTNTSVMSLSWNFAEMQDSSISNWKLSEHEFLKRNLHRCWVFNINHICIQCFKKAVRKSWKI